jgi:hypothetical protein
METMMTPKSSNSSRKSWSELDAEDDDEWKKYKQK